MLVNFDRTGRVIWYNLYVSKEDSVEYLSENTIWIEGGLPATESRDGYIAVFYINDDAQSIRVKYEPVTDPESTQLDRIEAQLTKSQDEIQQDGADLMMAELVKRGLMV